VIGGIEAVELAQIPVIAGEEIKKEGFEQERSEGTEKRKKYCRECTT
jgi:hypothetical protein